MQQAADKKAKEDKMHAIIMKAQKEKEEKEALEERLVKE